MWKIPDAFGALDASGLLLRLRWAIAELRSRGAKVPTPGRSTNALAFLESLVAADPTVRPVSDQESLLRFVALQRTAWELFLIVFASTQCKYDHHPFGVKAFERIVRGPDTKEGLDRSARNIEFELSVAARLCLGGLTVFTGEPDLRFNFRGELVGIAAKRVTSSSLTQVRRALKDAVDQITRSGIRGMIAINLEHRLDNLPAAASLSQLLAAAETAFEAIPMLSRNYSSNRSVRGVIVMSTAPRVSGHASGNQYPAVDLSIPWRITRFYNGGDNQAADEAFLDRWQDNLQRRLLWLATEWTEPKEGK